MQEAPPSPALETLPDPETLQALASAPTVLVWAAAALLVGLGAVGWLLCFRGLRLHRPFLAALGLVACGGPAAGLAWGLTGLASVAVVAGVVVGALGA